MAGKTTLLKAIVRALVPITLRDVVHRARYRVVRLRAALGDVPMLNAPTFGEDGLVSQHVVAFLSDPKFVDAYNAGKQVGALGAENIRFRAYTVCWAAQYASALPGDFVECGAGRGLLSKTVVEYLGFAGMDKRFFLFDTFEGIPLEQAGSASERETMKFLNTEYFNTSYFEDVKRSFSSYPNVVVVKGKIPESLSTVSLGPIAYLSIDMNNAFAEMEAIAVLWDKLVRGGIIVLDDYAFSPAFAAQKDAWDEFAFRKEIAILTLPTGQGMIIKSSDSQ